MREQSRQIVFLINVVSQLFSSITKFKLKRKLIAMFSTSEDLIIIDTQRVSNKRIVKFTKRVQTIRIEFVRVKKTKIHEKSTESLIFLNFETTQLEHESALFVNNNKHVSSQSDRVDSLTNAFSSIKLSISNQSFSESLVVSELVLIHESVFVSVSVLAFEIELNLAHR